MKTITKEWLAKKGACTSGVRWFLNQEETSTAKVMLKLVDEGRGDDALWVLERIMNKTQAVKVAVFSARLCLANFEKKYPDDDRPRKAIEAAEAYLRNPCKKTKEAAYSAAYSAYSAAYSAADSAYSAAYPADSAADSAAYSADSAAYSADSANSADSARKETQKTIITEAIKIIGLEK